MSPDQVGSHRRFPRQWTRPTSRATASVRRSKTTPRPTRTDAPTRRRYLKPTPDWKLAALVRGCRSWRRKAVEARLRVCSILTAHVALRALRATHSRVDIIESPERTFRIRECREGPEGPCYRICTMRTMRIRRYRDISHHRWQLSSAAPDATCMRVVDERRNVDLRWWIRPSAINTAPSARPSASMSRRAWPIGLDALGAWALPALYLFVLDPPPPISHYAR